ncbi:MAG: SOS response-associated peptidase family protein [Bacillota bacterium]|nr:SOS response-associated peptidase family protein [Bacillota bacterium]
MCGKYHISTEDENLIFREAIRQMMLEHPGIAIKTGDVLPSQAAPVYHKTGLSPMRFGHKANFAKSLIINARSETAHESPLFAPALRTFRVLVPATAFYEWSPQKKPHLFGRADKKTLYMAGLAFPGQDIADFVILTRDAAGKPAQVHPRMPVIFPSLELQKAWLEQDSLAIDLLRLPDEGEYAEMKATG